MIYLIGSYKGGSGKTTTATNLAVFLWRQGKRVLLIDGDEQKTLSYWYQSRAESVDVVGLDQRQLVGAKLRTELPALATQYDDVVIDVAGRDSTTQRAALTIADVYLVPFVPRPPDLWTFDLVRELIEKAKEVNPGLRAYLFITRADHQSLKGDSNWLASDTLNAIENAQRLNANLGNRVAFANAFNGGLSVLESKPIDSKARAEVVALFTELQTALHEKA
ncbi:MAG: chromosome partitioning protein ParA [Hymenobacter sp.]|nr:MAG: chromosome partitioning protein ParA [Hymenobacter sp.]